MIPSPATISRMTTATSLENCVEYRELLAENERLREEVARLNKEADWLGLRLWGTGERLL